MKKCLLTLMVLLLVAGAASAELKLWYQMDSADDFNLGQDIGGTTGRTYVTNSANGELASGMTAHSGIYFDPTENALYMNGVHPCKIMGTEDGDALFTGRTKYTFSLWAKADLGAVTGNGYSFYLWFSDGNKFKCDLSFQADKSACFSAPGSSWQNNVSNVWNPDPAYAYKYVDPETWNMYTFTWDADNNYVATYVNGTEGAHYTGPSGDVPAIGAGAAVTDFGFGDGYGWSGPGGWYKDFRVYDVVLNENEIITLANPVDINGDKSVDFDDLAVIVEDWLDSTDIIEADLNWDDIVNFEDYAIWADNLFEGGNYYFDSAGGNDNNLGTSPEHPWQSLTKFNSTTFLPSEKIYFKAGSQWDGSLQPKGSGTSEEPIIVDAYDNISDENNKPRFDGNGTVPVTIEIRNIEYWEFNNLQVTNLGAEPADWRRAVNISSSEFGQMNHIHCKNMYVHSVNGSDTFGGGAAFELSASDPSPLPRVSFVNDLLIENCHIKSIDNCGIHGGCGSATPGDAHGTNHIIRGNYFEDMGGAAVIVIGADGCIVENNVVNGCMKRYASCAMWPWGAFNTIFQYNEVYGCDDRGDGESFDSDYHCTGSIFQYNYSHDNPGGFMRICNDNEDPVGNVGTIVRYNISVNDGSSTDAIFPTWKRCDDVQIYNNIIYSPTGTVPLVDTSASGGDGAVWNWSNNIFYSNGILRYDISDGSTNNWSNNCFYGTHQIPSGWFSWTNGTPNDPYKITSNPNFVSPSLIAPMGIDNLDGFKLQDGSPCIGAGTTITDNGGYDFWDNLLYNGSPDIGGHEY